MTLIEGSPPRQCSGCDGLSGLSPGTGRGRRGQSPGTNEPEGVYVIGTGGIGSKGSEVGIEHVSPDEGEDTSGAEKQGWAQDCLCSPPDKEHNSEDEQHIPEGI